MDGDGQDDPAEIPALLAKLGEGYDVVSGWKQQRRDPTFKRWGSRLFNRLTAKLSGVPLHDVNCGLKAYRGPAVRSLEIYGEQHRFIPVLGFQRGWRVAEIPVHHRPRTQGRSKFGPERYARGLLDLFSVLFIGRYQYRPLHLFGGAGLISLFLGLLVCVYLTVVKLTGRADRRPAASVPGRAARNRRHPALHAGTGGRDDHRYSPGRARLALDAPYGGARGRRVRTGRRGGAGSRYFAARMTLCAPSRRTSGVRSTRLSAAAAARSAGRGTKSGTIPS